MFRGKTIQMESQMEELTLIPLDYTIDNDFRRLPFIFSDEGDEDLDDEDDFDDMDDDFEDDFDDDFDDDDEDDFDEEEDDYDYEEDVDYDDFDE
jgi:hypothetical protein